MDLVEVCNNGRHRCVPLVLRSVVKEQVALDVFLDEEFLRDDGEHCFDRQCLGGTVIGWILQEQDRVEQWVYLA